MGLILLLVIFGVAIFILVRLFRRRVEGRHLQRSFLALGLAIGFVRATLACVGWYVVEHTGAPAQVPAYVFAMLSWPEAALLPARAAGPASAGTYATLFLLLVTSSTAWIAVIAAVAKAVR